jgi:hypothetical protein
MAASTSIVLASDAERRLRPSHAPRPLAAALYCSLTGSGIDDWIRLDRNLRVLSMIGKVLMFVLALFVKEWLFERVSESVSNRE